MTRLRYVAISPARDDEQNLLRLASSLEAQSTLPDRWIVVENGSSDQTARVARELADRLPWVSVVSMPGTTSPEPGAPIVQAFHAGLAVLETVPDVVVKVDADVSMGRDYFECQLAAFESDARLGIASGTCLELRDGAWSPMSDATEGHVRGAARAYRRECLQEILPLPECVGWDGVDEVAANMRGWRTRMLPSPEFRHHRAVGERDRGHAARWRAQGRASWFMGYRVSYILCRALYRSRQTPAALTMFSSYVAAAVRGEPRYERADVRAHLRERQRLRRLVWRALR